MRRHSGGLRSQRQGCSATSSEESSVRRHPSTDPPDGDSRALIVEQVPRTLSQSTTNRYTSIGADTRITGSASGFVEVALGGDRSAVAVTLGGGIFVADAASSPVSSVITIDPVRILDRCTDVGLTGPFVSGVSQKLQVTGSVPMATGPQTAAPPAAAGVLLNMTAVEPTANGLLSVRPGDATGVPSTSFNSVDGVIDTPMVFGP